MQDKSVDIIQQYIKEKNIDKLKEILELSLKKVKELENAVSKIEENKLIEAFRKGNKSYLRKVLKDMGEQGDGGSISKIELEEKVDTVDTQEETFYDDDEEDSYSGY